MGVSLATPGLLFDAVSSIESFVTVFIYVYVLVIFAFILTSWIRLPYSPWLNRVQRFLYDVCDPYLRLFRRVLPSIGAHRRTTCSMALQRRGFLMARGRV